MQATLQAQAGGRFLLSSPLAPLRHLCEKCVIYDFSNIFNNKVSLLKTQITYSLFSCDPLVMYHADDKKKER